MSLFTHPLFRIVVRFLFYGTLIVGGLSLYVFIISIRPPRHVTGLTPSELGMEFEEVSITTDDDITLSAWFVPSERDSPNAVVICHGYPADKGDVLSFADFLHEDFNLFFFDFRAMGRSGGRITSIGWKETEDFHAAVRYLKSRGMERIGAVGFSMGGAVIIMAEDENIDAIVAESAYSNLGDLIHLEYRKFGIFRHPFVYATRLWGILFLGIDPARVSPEEHIGNITAPILLIHSEKDSMIPAEHARALKEANPNAELWMLDAVDHGSARLSGQGQYESRILNFLRESLAKRED